MCSGDMLLFNKCLSNQFGNMFNFKNDKMYLFEMDKDESVTKWVKYSHPPIKDP